MIMKNENEMSHHYVAGALSGVGGIIVGHPLDTAKVQLQTQQYKHGLGTWETMRILSKQGLVRGFYRGLGFPLATSVAVNSVYFGVFGSVYDRLQEGGSRDKNGSYDANYSLMFVAGCSGGLVQSFFVSPAEYIKVVLQSQLPNGQREMKHADNTGRYFSGPLQASAFVCRRHGLFGLYRSFPVLLAREVPTYGVYAVVYDWLHRRLGQIRVIEGSEAVPSILAGGMAGVIIWTLAIPFDVIKSLMQADIKRIRYKTNLDCVVQLYKSRGLAGFFTGLTVTWCRAFPVSAVTFLIYSQTLDYLCQQHRSSSYTMSTE